MFARYVVLLLPVTLTACLHLPHKQVQPPPALTEANAKNHPLDAEQPQLSATIPTEPVTPAPTQKITPRPKPARVRHLQPQPPPPAPATVEAANQSPAETVIGPLSSGESPNLRKQTADMLASIEKGLNGLDRKLSDQEQQTAGQIREYLKQAHTALSTGDVDGAHTLAAKAKLLLSELSE